MPTKRSKGPFPCEDCGKEFSRKEYAERHRRLTHLGERPYSCERCGNGFARSDLLKRHATSCGTAKQLKPVKLRGLKKQMPDESSPEAGLSPPGLASPAHPAHGFGYHPSAGSSSSSQLSPSGSDQSPTSADASSASSVETPPDRAGASLLTHEMVNRVYAVPPLNAAYANELSAAASTAGIYLGMGKNGWDDAGDGVGHDPWGMGGWTPSGGDGSGRELTAGEKEAQEVLESLLRSPRMSPPPSLGYQPDWSATATAAPPDQSALVSAGIGSVAPADFWSSYATDPAMHPELSAEADFFSNYFNHAGGVGGITALDLGFRYEPSVFPQHLFGARAALDPRRHMVTDRFAPCYLAPWSESLPAPERLEAFAQTATDRVLTRIPILHEPSMDFRDLPNHTVYALSVVGGAFELDECGQTFAGIMLCMKRVYLVKSFNNTDNTEAQRFNHLQSLLLYQLVGFYRDEQHRVESHTFHRAMCQMFWELALVSKVKKAAAKVATLPAEELAGVMLEEGWKAWVEVETWRRVAFIVYMLDLEFATHFNTPPLLAFTELDIALPSAEALWAAKDAHAWQRARLSPGLAPTVDFLGAVRALLAHDTCSPFSAEGLLLADLGRLDALPLLILTRGLSFLQMKTEEACAQADPLRAFAGVVDGAHRKAAEESDSDKLLRRIKQARAFMKDYLPGGATRGGGEGWAEEVMPTASGPRATGPKVQHPPKQVELNIGGIRGEAEEVARDWPGFGTGGGCGQGEAGRAWDLGDFVDFV